MRNGWIARIVQALADSAMPYGLPPVHAEIMLLAERERQEDRRDGDDDGDGGTRFAPEPVAA